MNIELRKLSKKDGREEYDVLQKIELKENGFYNPMYGKDYCEFKDWVEKMEQWSCGQSLKKGYVAQTIYWILLDKKPIGIGKIRHELTKESREFGGNIGYALAVDSRGKGYGTQAVKCLIDTAKEMGIQEKILTVEKYNYASKRVIEKCGGILYKESDARWYFKI